MKGPSLPRSPILQRSAPRGQRWSGSFCGPRERPRASMLVMSGVSGVARHSGGVRRPPLTPRVVAATVLALLTAAAAAVGLDLRPVGSVADVVDGLWPMPFLACAIVGVLLAARAPDHPAGWLFAGGAAAMTVSLAAQQYAADPRPGRAAVAVVCGPGFVAGWVALGVFALLLFPTGHLPSSRWRWVARAAALAAVAAALGRTVMPETATTPALPNPLAVGPAGLADAAASAGMSVVVVASLASALSLVLRYRRARQEERAQLRWLAAAVVLLLLSIPAGAVDGRAATVMFAVGGSAVPAAVAVAVTRYRLYELNYLVSRTLIYLVLSAVVVAAYVVVVVTPVAVLRSRTIGAVVAAAAFGALVAAPVRAAGQRAINRILYGAVDQPARVVSALAERLERAVEMEEVLPVVVEALASRLRLPYVAIRYGNGTLLAGHGAPRPAVEELPLHHRGQHVGTLIVAPRRGTDGLDGRDRAALAEIARHAGAAVHAVGLADALRQSRDAVVEAREQERRRLRRELHDRAASTLAGVLLGLERLRYGHDPELTETLHRETAEVLDLVRHFMDDLRPTVLDDLGLAGAVHARAADLEAATGLAVGVRVPTPLEGLPAAVEVAAYWVVAEGLRNVQRHARARTCEVTVERTAAVLTAFVADDGIGMAGAPPGIGLRSLRERVEEAGGALTAETGVGGGTSLTARFPAAS